MKSTRCRARYRLAKSPVRFNDRSPRFAKDSGASLVEFAFIVPLLFLLIFGVIEFGSAYFQQMDLRHGAREGMRLYAVNAMPSNSEPTQVKKIAREMCNRMDPPSGAAILVVVDVDGSLVADSVGDATPFDIGDEVTVTLTKDLQQLTGFLNPFLKDIELKSEVTTRLEQPASYSDLNATDGFTC